MTADLLVIPVAEDAGKRPCLAFESVAKRILVLHCLKPNNFITFACPRSSYSNSHTFSGIKSIDSSRGIYGLQKLVIRPYCQDADSSLFKSAVA